MADGGIGGDQCLMTWMIDEEHEGYCRIFIDEQKLISQAKRWPHGNQFWNSKMPCGSIEDKLKQEKVCCFYQQKIKTPSSPSLKLKSWA